jgi:hypothetical protein
LESGQNAQNKKRKKERKVCGRKPRGGGLEREFVEFVPAYIGWKFHFLNENEHSFHSSPWMRESTVG